MTFLRLSLLSALLSPLAPDEPDETAPEVLPENLFGIRLVIDQKDRLFHSMVSGLCTGRQPHEESRALAGGALKIHRAPMPGYDVETH